MEDSTIWFMKKKKIQKEISGLFFDMKMAPMTIPITSAMKLKKNMCTVIAPIRMMRNRLASIRRIDVSLSESLDSNLQEHLSKLN